jgi:hypothetical protein
MRTGNPGTEPIFEASSEVMPVSLPMYSVIPRGFDVKEVGGGKINVFGLMPGWMASERNPLRLVSPIADSNP